jgi:hypothetical protein
MELRAAISVPVSTRLLPGRRTGDCYLPGRQNCRWPIDVGIADDALGTPAAIQ